MNETPLNSTPCILRNLSGRGQKYAFAFLTSPFLTSLFISSQHAVSPLSIIEPMETIIGYNVAPEPNSNTLLAMSYTG